MIGTKHVSVDRLGDVVVAKLESPQITSEAAGTLCRMIRDTEGFPTPRAVVLDLSNLKFLSSVGISVLVAFLRKTKDHGAKLAIAGLDGLCRNVMTVMGLDKVFDNHKDVPTALESLRSVASVSHHYVG